MNFNFSASDEEKHSAAHVLATAVKRLFPFAKVGIGPVTKTGFYYDFDLGDHELSQVDLKKIETTANEIIKENLNFQQVMYSRESGQNMLLQIGEIYKAELINSIPDDNISFYKVGNEFIDLCRGPHVSSTGQLGIITVSNTEKVHWKDNPDRAKLTRIYGLLFKNVTEFNKYVEAKKNLKENNFITIGTRSNIISHYSSPNLTLSPRGTILIRKIQQLVYNKLREFRAIPLIISKSLEDVQANFEEISNIFNRQITSYKRLPLTYTSECLTKYEVNQRNVIFSTQNFKTFLQDQEIVSTLIKYVEALIDLSLEVSSSVTVDLLSTNIEDQYVATISNYLQKKIVSHNKVITSLPQDTHLQLDFKLTNSNNSVTKIISLALKKNSADKFMNAVNHKETAITIECNINSFMMMVYLLEEYRTKLPIKLHPITTKCIPINNKYVDYAFDIKNTMNAHGIICEVDTSAKKFTHKIKNAEKQSVPFIFVVGNKEMSNKAISVRKKGQEIGLLNMEDAINHIKQELAI